MRSFQVPQLSLVSQPCLAVVARKLAAQLDPNILSSALREKAIDQSPPSAGEHVYRRVARESRDAAEFARTIEQGANQPANVGMPLFMIVGCSNPKFSQLFDRALPSKLLCSTFAHYGDSPWNPSSFGIQQPNTVFVFTDNATVAMPVHRPPSRELHRFLGAELADGTQLAWLDEILHFDKRFLGRSLSPEIDNAVEEIRVRNVLHKNFAASMTLLCTTNLSGSTMSAIQQYVDRYAEFTREMAQSGGPSELADHERFQSIIMPGQTASFKPSPLVDLLRTLRVGPSSMTF